MKSLGWCLSQVNIHQGQQRLHLFVHDVGSNHMATVAALWRKDEILSLSPKVSNFVLWASQRICSCSSW